MLEVMGLVATIAQILALLFLIAVFLLTMPPLRSYGGGRPADPERKALIQREIAEQLKREQVQRQSDAISRMEAKSG